jgi:hypothetical protein
MLQGACCHRAPETPRSGGDRYQEKQADTKHWWRWIASDALVLGVRGTAESPGDGGGKVRQRVNSPLDFGYTDSVSRPWCERCFENKRTRS